MVGQYSNTQDKPLLKEVEFIFFSTDLKQLKDSAFTVLWPFYLDRPNSELVSQEFIINY